MSQQWDNTWTNNEAEYGTAQSLPIPADPFDATGSQVYDVTGYAGTQYHPTTNTTTGSVPTRQVTTTSTRNSGHVATSTHAATTAHKKNTKKATVHKKAPVKPKKAIVHKKHVPFGEKAF